MNDLLAKHIDLVFEFSSLAEFKCSVIIINNLSVKFQSGSYHMTSEDVEYTVVHFYEASFLI